MKRAVTLVVALSMVAVFSGVALAGGGFGGCSYSSYTSQAAVDKVDTSKPVATQVLPKAETDKLILAKTDKPNQAMATTKK